MPLSSLALRGDNGRPIPNLRPSDVQAVPTPALLTETQTPGSTATISGRLPISSGVSSTKRVRRAISRVITHLDDLGPSVNKLLPCREVYERDTKVGLGASSVVRWADHPAICLWRANCSKILLIPCSLHLRTSRFSVLRAGRTGAGGAGRTTRPTDARGAGRHCHHHVQRHRGFDREDGPAR